MSDPCALSAAGDVAGRHALESAGAQRCLVTSAAIGTVRSVMRANADVEASKLGQVVLLGAALASAHVSEARWREATSAAYAAVADGSPNASALPNLLVSRAAAAAAARTALTQAYVCSSGSIKLLSAGGGGKGGDERLAEAAAALRAVQQCNTSQGGREFKQGITLADAEEELDVWLDQHGNAVVAAVQELGETFVRSSGSAQLNAAYPALVEVAHVWLSAAAYEADRKSVV